MRTALATLLAVALFASAAAAQQPFRVMSVTPPDGAANTPLSGSLAVTFTEAVAAPPALLSLPLDSIQVGAATVSADGRTVTYPVTRTPNTVFVHLVLGAEAASGAALDRPHAWNYTTGASAGSFRFGGTVTAEDGSPEGTIVAVVGLGTDGSFSLVDATVLGGSTGAYTLGPVPTGIYTVVALRLPGAEPPRTFAYGFYDPNGDGTPDPALPLPLGTTNITIRTPQPVTARARYGAAEDEAVSAAPDAAFFAVPEMPVDTLGRAPLWTFAFYSAARDSTISVASTGLIPLAISTPGGPPALVSVPPEWVDTDLAVSAAEGAGGTAFRAAHAARPQALTVRGGAFADVPSLAPAWRVAYRALDAGGGTTDSLVVYVDMATGAVIGTTAAEPGAHADVALEAAAPNPAVGAVTIAYRLGAPGDLRLAVYDALGRRVAVLAEGRRPAGRHVATWQPGAGVAPGVYVVRLEAGRSVAVRPVTVAR